jgi:hypothetical protein
VTRATGGALVAVLLVTAACSGSSQDGIELDSVPATASTAAPTSTSTAGTGATPATTAPATTAPASGDVTVTIDAGRPGATISPGILGVSSTLTAGDLQAAGLTINSWGGNPATRYNYDIGHAWNQGSDFEFRNTNYGDPGPDSARNYVESNAAAGVQTRMAIPTLGWVAKNDDPDDCSFPKDGGGCLPAAEVGDCKNQKVEADPTRANVESTPEKVAAWLHEMAAAGAVPQYVSMDNEPDLWGNTHYDVHPDCPTYEEILDKYQRYAAVVREAMPDAALTGPALCCWYDYWHIAPGPADGGDDDFVAWFLDGLKAADDASGKRSIDYLDVHYYPQSDVFNEKDNAETNARRLRSTRSLWDPDYTDESWIDTEIRFIPRMRETIAEHYPGLKLFISEWNFGNDTHINGALAIADVLGIYGREGVEAAAYWRNPPVGSPGWFAFTMYGNYDGKGGRFGGVAVPATVGGGDDDADDVGAYAALDQGVLRVMLVNRSPDAAIEVGLDIKGFTATADAARYVYSAAHLDGIVADTTPVDAPLTLPASSITVLELASG